MALDEMLAPRKVVNNNERARLVIGPRYTLVDTICREDDHEDSVRSRGLIEKRHNEGLILDTRECRSKYGEINDRLDARRVQRYFFERRSECYVQVVKSNAQHVVSLL
jgi:hypothetical protein